MSEITQVLTLKDNVTNPIMRMYAATLKLIKAEDNAVSSTMKTQNAFSSMSGSVGAATEAEKVATARANELAAAMNNMGQAASSGSVKLTELGTAAINTGNKFGFIKSAIGEFAIGNMLANAANEAIRKISKLPGKIMDAADAYGSMMARLRLVAGSQEEAVKMNDLIFQSALRARGSYEDIADSVGKIGLNAKAAFPNPKEIVPFVEEVQKLFAIGGTDMMQQKAAMLQLTQALGSGRLQGDEFRSIAEAAPLIEQMAAKYMGVEQGQLRQLASDGKLTADILKKAILSNANEIDEMFKQVPMQFGQAFTIMGNIFYKAMQPVYAAIEKMAGGSFMQGLITAVSVLTPLLSGMLLFVINGFTTFGNLIGRVGTLLSEAIDWVLQFDEVITGVIVGVTAWWLMLNAAMIAHSIISGVVWIKTMIVQGAMFVWRTAIMAVTAAQWLLNIAMTANPIGIIIALVAIAIAAFVTWAVKIHGLRNIFAATFQAIGDIVSSSVNFMIDMLNKAIEALNKLADGINNTFHTNLGHIGVVGHIDNNLGGKWSQWAKDFNITGMLSGFDASKIMGGGGGYSSDTDTSAALGGGGSGGGGGGAGKAARETADNTKAIADMMGIMNEDIKFMRDIAEREAINQYTTAKVEVNLGGVSQNISNGVDADGVITHLVDKLNEAVISGSEAVHV